MLTKEHKATINEINKGHRRNAALIANIRQLFVNLAMAYDMEI